MSDDKTIKNFTATDIKKYWNKELTPAEMREVEKAAMDDPFFADALEGYQSSINTNDELKTLKERINKKTNDAALVIFFQRKKYSWLRVAAAVIILVGAGLLVQQIAFKTKNEAPLVTMPQKKVEKTNSDVVLNSTPIPDSIKNEAAVTESAAIEPVKKNNIAVDLNSSYAFTPVDSSKNVDNNTNALFKEKVDETLQNGDVVLNRPTEKKEATNDKAGVVNAVTAPASTRSETETALRNKAFAESYKQASIVTNSFNYRIVDAQNNPVPFANVLNTRDNVGTYTDVRGYFNLVSSDSILNVQVKSLGYNSEFYRLIPSKQTNNLILKEDASARNNMMDLNQGRRVMSNVSRKDSADLDEPEVGWGNYNTYVENNIKIPENVRAKNALNEVELSFDVDRSGTPINIKVTRSSKCKECDDEAMRLLKDGPKWKKKGKKSKTTISISVDQK